MEMNEITLKDLISLQNLLSNNNKSNNTDDHWEVGKNYFLRTVTHHLCGHLIKVTTQELVFNNTSWIPDDGRFHKAVKNGDFNEIEPFPAERKVIVGRGALIDAISVDFDLPKEPK